MARNKPYPFLIKGINTSFKYRFLNVDEHRKHFRAAITGTYSSAKSAHDEAEANLIDDNAGDGAGLIATILISGQLFLSINQYSIPEPFEQDTMGNICDWNYGIHSNSRWRFKSSFTKGISGV